MTLQNLFYLEAVFEYGSILKASKILNVSQPAITKGIHELEREYHVTLLTRSHKNVRLTPLAQQILPYIRAIQQNTQSITEVLNGDNNDMCSIGINTVAELFLPAIAKELSMAFPSQKFNYVNTNMDNLSVMLQQGTLRFAITDHDASFEQFHSKLIGNLPMHIFASVNAPIADQLTLEEVLEHPLILREQGSSNRRSLDEVIQQHKLSYSTFIESFDNACITEMVSQGYGVTLLADALIPMHFKTRLKRIQITDAKFVRSLSLLYDKRIPITAYEEKLMDQITKTLRKHVPFES